MVYTRAQRALSGKEYPERVHGTVTEDWPLAFARWEFLSIVDEEAPEVVEDLRQQVFPLFEIGLQVAPSNLLDLHD